MASDKESFERDIVSDPFRSIQNLAQKIDAKLPQLERKSHHALEVPNENYFPYDGWNKLQGFKKEVENLISDCKSQIPAMKQSNAVLVDLNKCADLSLKMAQAHVSLLEATFAVKGFVLEEDPCVEAIEVSDGNPTTSANLDPKLPVEKINFDDEKTYIIKNGSIKPRLLLDENVDSQQDIPKSPMTPGLEWKQRSSIPPTPVLPETLKMESQAYFSTMTPQTPELGVFKKVTLPKKAATELLFPDLKSPTTPVFLEDANNCVEQRTKLETIKQSKAFDSSFDDDQFVLHSNLHLLNQQETDVPEPSDTTVNLLNTEKVSHKLHHQVSTPDTPGLDHNGLLNPAFAKMSTRYFGKPTGGEGGIDNELQSPVLPEFLTTKACNIGPQRVQSPAVNRKAYQALPASIKRLVSYEEAAQALQKIHQLDKKFDNTMTYTEIEKAVGLGEKTKCCVLLLTTLNALHKIPGTNKYEVAA
ncbi:unnamed protein product [Clavelina lepadiformis]|uniref:Spindle and kinetochore-associated protein 3 n=2 Tax=Clavelina lepadiformis TaxID=159417 RepID=A0ABP0GZR5_CLALP